MADRRKRQLLISFPNEQHADIAALYDLLQLRLLEARVEQGRHRTDPRNGIYKAQGHRLRLAPDPDMVPLLHAQRKQLSRCQVRHRVQFFICQDLSLIEDRRPIAKPLCSAAKELTHCEVFKRKHFTFSFFFSVRIASIFFPSRSLTSPLTRTAAFWRRVRVTLNSSTALFYSIYFPSSPHFSRKMPSSITLRSSATAGTKSIWSKMSF